MTQRGFVRRLSEYFFFKWLRYPSNLLLSPLDKIKYSFSFTDTTAEEDTDDSLDEVEPLTEMTRFQNQMPVDHKDSNMKKPIQIVISSDSPSNSSLKLTASKDFENRKESKKRKNLIDDASKDSPANQFSEQNTRDIRAKEVVNRVIKDAMNSKFDNVESDCRSL